MNRTVFSLPPESQFVTAAGLAITRRTESFSGGARLDALVETLDRRRGVMLSSGTTVPGRYESFDLGFADPPLSLTTAISRARAAALRMRVSVGWPRSIHCSMSPV